jgi:hypothetical protein
VGESGKTNNLPNIGTEPNYPMVDKSRALPVLGVDECSDIKLFILGDVAPWVDPLRSGPTLEPA